VATAAAAAAQRNSSLFDIGSGAAGLRSTAASRSSDAGVAQQRRGPSAARWRPGEPGRLWRARMLRRKRRQLLGRQAGRLQQRRRQMTLAMPDGAGMPAVALEARRQPGIMEEALRVGKAGREATGTSGRAAGATGVLDGRLGKAEAAVVTARTRLRYPALMAKTTGLTCDAFAFSGRTPHCRHGGKRPSCSRGWSRGPGSIVRP